MRRLARLAPDSIVTCECSTIWTANFLRFTTTFMFFSFDGVDGAGKSTQIGLLADALLQQGREVVTCRDPGGTALGERLREILLHDHDLSINRRSEMLL